MLNKTNLLDIVAKQIMLDKTILQLKNLELNDEMIAKKIVALLVEMGEFINEERSFKYWSVKPASAKNILLEEYIDGIHFIISLGTNINFDFTTYEYKFLKNELTEAYLTCFEKIIDFKKDKTASPYAELLNAFFSIGQILNFSEDDLIAAYYHKNEINFQRQDNNY